MSTFFESIQRGMEETIAHSKGEIGKVRVFNLRDLNAKNIRKETGLAQGQFAATSRISVAPCVIGRVAIVNTTGRCLCS